MKRVHKLLFNTVVLTAATFLMRTVEVSFNVYLTNKIGASGIGLFQLIMTVYALAVTFASSGIKLASTRLTVDAVDVGEERLSDVMKNCFFFALFMGIAVASALYLSADFISVKWLNDERSAISLKILSAALPFTAVSAVLSGYYTAARKASVFAVIQVVEQFVKIGIIVFALTKFLPLGVKFSCVAIVTGISFSEIVSSVLSYILYKLLRPTDGKIPKSKNIVKKMLRIAVPDMVGSSVRSVLLTIEHLLIPVGFKKSGTTQDEALSIYGRVHGMVFPLILYPSSVLGSLSGLLVPEIAEYNAKKMKNQIDNIIEIVLKWTLLFSILTMGIMYSFSDLLSCAVYHNGDCSQYIAILAPLIPVMYMDMIVDGMLKGLDQQLSSMKYNILDSGMCVVLVYFLIPKFAIKGYIFILFISEIFNFSLSIRRLITVANVRINIVNSLIKPIVAVALSGWIFKLINITMGNSVINFTVCAVLFCVFYSVLLYISGAVKKSDIKTVKNLL